MTETLEELWFVLLMHSGSEVVTENPRHEMFCSEKEAVAFAKNSAREDREGGEDAVYYVFRSVCAARSTSTVRVQMISTRAKKASKS